MSVRVFEALKTCLGRVEGGTNQSVSISQDDATMDYIVRVGDKVYSESDLAVALLNACADIDPYL
jgi:hypothetical protein